MLKILSVEDMDPRGEVEGMSLVEELVQLILDLERPDRFGSIGSLLEPDHRERLIQYLKKNLDIFVWSHEDKPGIDPQIVSYRLNVDPSFLLIKQKRKGMAPK